MYNAAQAKEADLMSLQDSGKHRASIIALLLLAFLFGAGIAMLVQASIVCKLENRLIATEKELENATSSQNPTGTYVDIAPDCEGVIDDEDDCVVDEDATTETMLSWTAYALLSDARYTDGVTFATLDYIQVLTGDAATEAAAAHGKEATPEGYYIVNECPAFHEYPIDADITISVVYNDVTGWDPDSPVFLSLGEWRQRAILSMETMYGIHYYSMYHIVTVTNGTITAMDQQYLP